MLIEVTLLIHSAQSHKEYRFIFVVVPLWLSIGADCVEEIASRAKPAKRAMLQTVGTHIVTEDPSFGRLRILRGEADVPAVRQWEHYALTFQTGFFGETARQLYRDAPPVPPNAGIRFADDPSRSIR